MRVVYVTLAVILFAALAVSAVDVDMEDEAPVPEGFSLPNIFNPVLDRADGRDQAKTLVNLVAKEPKVAYGVGGPAAAVEDLWNGEKDPESSASVAQKKMLREVDSLTKLIEQGKKILKVLPRKQKRLALLKKKLSKILDAKAKRIASEKLEEQQALLNAIKKREGKMSTRLSALKKSQSKLTKSVGKLKKVIAGKKPKGRKLKAKKGKGKKKAVKGKGKKKATKGKGKKKATKKGKKSKKGKKGKKNLKKKAGEAAQPEAPRSLLEAEAEADAEAELEAEVEQEGEVEGETEAEQEAEAEQQMEFEAEQE